jgi:PKD repeat protein
MSLNYLSDFYSTAQQYSSKLPVGASYKGFNDTLASWSANRIMQQQCGQTWLSSFGKANSMWSVSKQLAWFQLVTWNDYEEATEIETGIDNCVSVSTSIAGSTLNWSITGNENTLDHYTVFISNDGQNLMSLGDFPIGTHSLDLSSYGFPSGPYSLYVKAVGKPSILNHISAAASYTSDGGGQPQPPVARLSVTPGSGTAPMTVTASTLASTDPQASALASTITFGDGAAATGPTASHTYANPGRYTVTATVMDALHLQSQATASVSISAAPTLNVIQPQNNLSSPSPIHVVANGSAPSGVDAMQIYLDGALVYQLNAASFDTTVPAGAGTHAVVVKLWDKLGNAYMKSVKVAVTAPLAVSLAVTPKTVTLGGSIQATVTATAGSIGSSFIYWGDGSYSSGPNASHTYASTGTYTVNARAADFANAVSVGAISVTVQPKPGVVMQSPTANSVVPLSMHVLGFSSSPIGIVAMQIYVDGALVYQNALSQVDTYLNVSTGTHLVALKAWDSAGAAYMQTATVTAK